MNPCDNNARWTERPVDTDSQNLCLSKHTSKSSCETTKVTDQIPYVIEIADPIENLHCI
jgi:hypothetical protein